MIESYRSDIVETKRNNEIQILRGIAVILTFLAHVSATYPQLQFLDRFYWSGGVDIFFVISGYVISKSLFPKFEKQETIRGQVIETVSFWLKRVYRLLPTSLFWASYLLICAFVFTSAWVFAPPNLAAKEFLTVLLYSKNIFAAYGMNYSLGPYWSLSLEEQFYFILPFLLILYPKVLNVRICLPLIILTSLFPELMGPQNGYFKINGFLLGILIYQLEISSFSDVIRPNFLNNNLIRNIFLTCLVGLIIVVTKIFHMFPGATFYINIFSGALVFAASYNMRFISTSRILDRLLAWVGDRSYSFYVCHVPVLTSTYAAIFYATGIQMKNEPLIPAIVAAFSAFVITFIVAHFSFIFIERPTQSTGRHKAKEFETKYLV